MFVSEVSRFVFFHLMISVLKISQVFWWWVWGVFECFRVFSISPSRTPMMIKYNFVCWRVEGTKLYRVRTSRQVIFEHAAFYWTSGHWPKKRSPATKKDLSLPWEDIYCIFVYFCGINQAIPGQFQIWNQRLQLRSVEAPSATLQTGVESSIERVAGARICHKDLKDPWHLFEFLQHQLLVESVESAADHPVVCHRWYWDG